MQGRIKWDILPRILQSRKIKLEQRIYIYIYISVAVISTLNNFMRLFNKAFVFLKVPRDKLISFCIFIRAIARSLYYLVKLSRKILH